MLAPSSPASRTCGVTISSRTSPLPTVAATAVPHVSGATKFQNAAQITAHSGRNTRVDTTVAIELAASCQPFVKSKARLTTTITISRWNELTTQLRQQSFQLQPELLLSMGRAG